MHSKLPLTSKLFKLLFVSFAIILLSTSAIADDRNYLNRIKQLQLEPNRESIAAYLDSLHATEKTIEKAFQLIMKLGDQQYRVRESATAELLMSSKLPVDVFERIKKLDDLELRWRAEQVLEKSAYVQDELFYAVMRVIANKKIKGLAKKTLLAIPLFPKKRFDAACRSAILATYEPSDQTLIRKSLKHNSPRIKKAAVYVLAGLDDQSVRDDVRQLLANDDDSVVFFTARSLANGGDRKSLAALIGLLDSSDVAIRAAANSTLRSYTHQQFGYVAYGEKDSRQAAVNSWKKWLGNAGTDTKLYFPLKDQHSYTGKIFVCNYSKNFVFVIDEEGKELWRKEGISQPWGVQVLPNGNRLVAACTGHSAIEYDVNGKEVWKSEKIPGSPLSVQRLENGNTLVSTGGAGKVVEIGRDGKITSEIRVGGFVSDAVRLPNGRTLIAKYSAGTVVEVDKAGKVVWEIGGFRNTRSAKRLENGNTLVTDYGNKRVVECNRNGDIIWEHKGLTSPYDCERLPDGRTLISGATGVSLVDSKGKTIWRREITNASRIFAH